MSDAPKTKAEFLAAIEEAKAANAARLESLRKFREIADRLLTNPATPPEDIAMIEQRFEQVQAMLDESKTQERMLADMFFEYDVDKLFADEGPQL